MDAEAETQGGRSGAPLVPTAKIVESEFEDAQSRLRTTLLEHLGNAVNESDGSDLEFVCSDETTVKASKLLLRGRSAVVDKMLTSGMLESSLSVIKLPEISSDVLLYLLDILYAGNSVHHPLVNWKMALEAISAAHFFLLPDIDKVVRKFMWALVEKVTEEKDFSEAASMLTAAIGVKCMVHDEDHIVLELMHLLHSKWWRFPYASLLSEEAVSCILRNTNTKSDSKADFSLQEYFRIRAAVLWCVTQHETDSSLDSRSAAETQRLIDNSMPFRKDDLYKVDYVRTSETEVEWLPNFKTLDLGDGKVRQVLSREECQAAIARLLKSIDWMRIPTALLVKIIGPLQILPSSQYVEIVEGHALLRDVKRGVKLSCRWLHGPYYTTNQFGSVIRKSEYGPGWAVCQLESRPNDEILQWRICFYRMSYCDVHLGLAFEELNASSQDGKDCAPANSSLPPIPMIRIAIHKNWREPALYPVVGPHPLARMSYSQHVLFTVNQKERSCTVNVDGREFSRREDLASGKPYPAVDLGRAEGPQARIEFIRGFNPEIL